MNKARTEPVNSLGWCYADSTNWIGTHTAVDGMSNTRLFVNSKQR
ncbi:MAG: hypothetical protein AAFO04_03215 [Cyanobacteria bacterium J06592_8]